jgi:Na+/H+-dicarboxylate symporter
MIFIHALRSMGLFMFTVVISLAIHTLAVLPLLYFILTRRNPYSFMRSMSQVIRQIFH